MEYKEKNERIINSIWFLGPRQVIGIVAHKVRGGWKARIGTGFGHDQHMDEVLVMDTGAKVTEGIARAAFPEIKDPYKF
jgi:hypothetical protein